MDELEVRCWVDMFGGAEGKGAPSFEAPGFRSVR
jgi:hypothetical protein